MWRAVASRLVRVHWQELRAVRGRAAWRRPITAFVVASLAVSACSGSSAGVVDAPEVVGEPVTAAASPTATTAPTPAPSPTAQPTPTPLPTPTPTVEPLIPADLLVQAIDENFAALDDLGVTYSFQLHTDDMGVIAQRQATERLLPASNQKLVTALGALELLPEDFRFVTEVRLDADRNLFVVGGGDPTLETRHVEAFAEELVEQLAVEATDDGPITIGDVVVDPSYFPPTRSGPGWPARYIPVDVGPMSGLMIDNNQHRGDDAYVSAPDFGNAELIADVLTDAGVEILGNVRVGSVDPSSALVVRRNSAKLPRLVDVMLGRSDNEVAEALVREIGKQFGTEAEIPAGQAVIYQRIFELGLDLGEPVGDGSGLSRDNRLSAQELVDVLVLSRERPFWDTISAGLAGAGVDGTLAARLDGDTTIGNVRAKTGTLDDVRALSGVLTTIDGVEVVFSFLINDIETEQAEDVVEAMDQIIVAYASATLPQLL